MSDSFIQKMVSGINGKGFRLNLNDHVVVFCRDGFRCEGELLGYSTEAIVVGLKSMYLWIRHEWIGAVGLVRQKGGDEDEWQFPSAQDPVQSAPSNPDIADVTVDRLFHNGSR